MRVIEFVFERAKYIQSPSAEQCAIKKRWNRQSAKNARKNAEKGRMQTTLR